VQVGKWTVLGDAHRNAAWMPPAAADAVGVRKAAPAFSLGAGARTTWLALGAAGFVAVAVLAVTGRGGDALTVSRGEAADLARQTLAGRGVTLDERWRVLPIPEDGSGIEHEFVAETAGEARRRELVGRYVSRPRWQVRVATFEGDVAERAEEWRVYVWAPDDVGFVIHTLPEGRPGESLDEESARQLAHQAVAGRSGLDAAAGEIREVSATPQQQPERTDWTFVFADTTVASLPEGEPRLLVRIAGDEVVQATRFLFIPEEWSRDRRSAATRNDVIGIAAVFLLAGILIAAAIGGVVSWSRGRYSPRLFVLATALALLVSGVSAVNTWPSVLAGLSTAQPIQFQLIALVGVGIIGLAGLAGLIGLALGALPNRLASPNRLPEAEAIRTGLALGLFGAGVVAVTGWLRTPAWADFPAVAAMGSFVPMVDVAIGPVMGLLTRAAIVVTAFAFIDKWSQGWTRYRGLALFLLVLLGFLATGGPAGTSFGAWVGAGVLLGAAVSAAYLTVLRADLSVLPLVLGPMAAVAAVSSGLEQPFPGALLGSLLGAVLTMLVSWWLFRALRTDWGDGGRLVLCGPSSQTTTGPGTS
jgi:hypothetical protein